MTVSRAQRRLVRDRAGDCCEYCRLPASASIIPFHVDHITPAKHGGLDHVDNLCLACFKCNAHKSHDLGGLDPETGELTRLYNPREQVWSKHFAIEDNLLIQGLTAAGRTTVRVLQMNDVDRVENRQILADIGEYSCEKA